MNIVPGLLLLAATSALCAPPEAIQRVTLDERVVITVPVSTNRVTTISFPGPIAAIDAVGVTADGKTPGNFQLAHTKVFVRVRSRVGAQARQTWTSAGTNAYAELIEGVPCSRSIEPRGE
jgi:hypothetical protein